MDKLIEQSLNALLAREGLEAKAGDLEEFSAIIELYLSTLKTLHSVDLGAEGRRAIEVLFDRARAAGIVPAVNADLFLAARV